MFSIFKIQSFICDFSFFLILNFNPDKEFGVPGVSGLTRSDCTIKNHLVEKKAFEDFKLFKQVVNWQSYGKILLNQRFPDKSYLEKSEQLQKIIEEEKSI